MKQLKKLSCSINVENLMGKAFEKAVLQVLSELFTEFREQYSSCFVQYFYYPESIDYKKLEKFKKKFSEFSDFVRFEPMSTFNIRDVWYVILTEAERDKHQSLNNRSYSVLKEVTKDSLILAFLDFYFKASMLKQISIKGSR